MILAANQSKVEENKLALLTSFKRFLRVFFQLKSGSEFYIACPISRENHIDIVCKHLTDVFKLKSKRLIVNIPPRYGKTTAVIFWICFCIAHNPRSNFLYVSYAYSLATKQTQTIRDIINMMEFREYFGVTIRDDVSAKDYFEFSNGDGFYGSVRSCSITGGTTGHGAGVKNSIGFNGAIIIDDIHKPDEATSDVIRKGVIDWYYNTLQSRTNSPTTPIVFIGQRVHEDDLAAHLINTGEWDTVIIPALDAAGNPLDPETHDIKTLELMRQTSPYVYAAQYQQSPSSPDTGVFKEEWFNIVDETPKLVANSGFIVCDTAETASSYNDATVFSYFALSEIWFRGQRMDDMYGLHWIDCREMRIEPKDLQNAFLQFWADCRTNPISVSLAAIERKSTGVTLCSVLKDTPGLRLIEVSRSGSVNSKANRFLETQPFVAQRRISLPVDGRHTKMCIDHMKKITASMVHKFDDIADTLCDAVKIALIDKTVINSTVSKTDHSSIARSFASSVNKNDMLKRKAYGR